MAAYVELRRRADRLFHERDCVGALCLYRQLLDFHPGDHAVKLHAADALARLGLARRAAQIYAAVALGHLKAGRPLQGVAALAALLGIIPGAGDVVPTLADLYGRGSPRVDPAERPPPAPAPPMGDLRPAAAPVPPAELIHSILALAAAVDPGPEPPTLPPLPILSDLDQRDLEAVLRHVRRRRFRDGDSVMRQGEAGDAFFLVAHGGVRITRTEAGETRTLATLGPGAILGEMALVTRAPRSATVTALGDVDAIEIPVRALAQVAGDSDGVAAALDLFTRDRLLRNALSGSRLFRPFGPGRVGELMGLFVPRDFDDGTVIVDEGGVGEGLHLVLSGGARVTRGEEDGREVELAEVGPGDVLGEMSLLAGPDARASATVRAVGHAMTLFLPRDSFDALVADSPAVAEELAHLGTARRVVNAFVMDDEFVAAEAAEEGGDLLL